MRMTFFGVLIGLVAANCGAVEVTRGMEREDSRPQLKYGVKRAIIVGINYASSPDPQSAPTLDNAENDAIQMRDTLVKHFGYSAKKGDIKLLIGKDASFTAIMDALGELANPDVVKPEDSILFFFSGHGDRLVDDKTDRTAIFPADVKIAGGMPYSNYIRLKSDLVHKIQAAKARHKLIILDSCYSGEIVRLGFQPPSETDDSRNDPELFNQPVVQAIASCRASQRSLDAANGSKNSPFTESLLRAMQFLPKRNSGFHDICASELFQYSLQHMRRRRDLQDPQFGTLTGDGEFRFLPDSDDDSSTYFGNGLTTDDTFKLLQASVPSAEGEWWFDEMPWFIPSLRFEILDAMSKERSSNEAFVNKEDLWNATRRLIANQESTDAKTTNAAESNNQKAADKRAEHDGKSFDWRSLHISHAKRLLVEGKDIDATLNEIATELEAAMKKAAESSPYDLHFLAAIYANQNDERADATFQQAISAYRKAISLDHVNEKKHVETALLALCLADYGQMLSGNRQVLEAIDQFHEAEIAFGVQAPAAFRIFVLCRQAELWLSLNRWSNADDELDEARGIAEVFGPEHQLAAHVYRRLAWARMIQWRIREADHWFKKSNRVVESINEKFRRSTPQAADSVPGLDPPLDSKITSLPVNFRSWESVESKIAYLHNQHGLAMAQRFFGDPKGAAASYRTLSSHIESTITDVAGRGKGSSSVSRRVLQDEAKLYDRLVNSLERLGDCNLLCDPGSRDLKEAVDDYRRALSRCHRKTKSGRLATRAGLLYKRAIALALPSDVQDLELAKANSQAADKIYQELYATSSDDNASGKPSATGLRLILGLLTTKIIDLVDAKANGDSESTDQAASVLRRELVRFRDEHGPMFHRDQLEFCLLATKLLIEHGDTEKRFELGEDGELLLSFCRTALEPFEYAGGQPTDDNSRLIVGDMKSYLRPYFDCVVQSRLERSRPGVGSVKDLIEIYHEATTGVSFNKSEADFAKIAFYRIGDECYLFVDVPQGPSAWATFTDDYELGEIQKSLDTGDSMRLPRNIERMLVAWEKSRPKTNQVMKVKHYIDDVVSIKRLRDIKMKYSDSSSSPVLLPSGYETVPLHSPPNLLPTHDDEKRVVDTSN